MTQKVSEFWQREAKEVAASIASGTIFFHKKHNKHESIATPSVVVASHARELSRTLAALTRLITKDKSECRDHVFALRTTRAEHPTHDALRLLSKVSDCVEDILDKETSYTDESLPYKLHN